jgi:predicted XRE-type DNA-binding protein
MSEEMTHEVSSGNVFADLGVSKAEEMLAKAQLAQAIIAVIEDRGLTQQQAARLLGTNQSYISMLKRDRELRRFTFDRLLHWLNRLDRDATLTVARRPSKQGGATVHVAAG